MDNQPLQEDQRQTILQVFSTARKGGFLRNQLMQEEIYNLCVEYSPLWTEEAIRVAARKGKQLDYAISVLRNWKRDGHMTLERNKATRSDQPAPEYHEMPDWLRDQLNPAVDPDQTGANNTH